MNALLLVLSLVSPHPAAPAPETVAPTAEAVVPGTPAHADRCRSDVSTRFALLAAGLSPAALAAAGVEPQQAAAVYAMAQAEFIVRGHALDAAFHEARVANEECRRLEDLALRGLASPAQRGSLPEARDRRAAAMARRSAAVESFFSQCATGLSPDQIEALHRIAHNARTALPIEFRVLDLSPDQAGELRSLLAADRIAADRGEGSGVELNITPGEEERADRAAADAAMNLDLIEALWASQP
ncbi:MAG: hypothetical protein JNK25_15430 [Phycisphaerae bacterium]|nr:hypothetical protein [Phycisphaerae bacterium]